MLREPIRILTFRARAADYAALDRRHLVLGLLLTWLVGIGRYWDNPRVEALQRSGLGSVAYVFALAALLWLLGLALKPERWSYLHLLTFVTLTAPPGLLYAIPVERFLAQDAARTTNLWFLAVVAAWRVAMYALYLRRHAAFPWAPLTVQLLLPLTLIVTVRTFLNLERATFNVMGGVEDGTPADAAYELLFVLTVFSVVVLPLLLIAYVGLVLRRRGTATGTS